MLPHDMTGISGSPAFQQRVETPCDGMGVCLYDTRNPSSVEPHATITHCARHHGSDIGERVSEAWGF